MDDSIAAVVGITGASEDAARQLLDMCSGDLEHAIQLWFNDEELQRSLTNPSASTAAVASSSSRAPPPIPHSTRPRAAVGRQDSNGVIHIDSDDEDDVQMYDNDDDAYFDEAADAATVARTAQEEEDAAMAKRLQEELFQGPTADEDGVRAPMARVTETLVGPSGAPWDPDDHDEMDARIMEQLRRRQQLLSRAPRHNPFSQSIWEDPTNPGHPAAPGPAAAASGQSARAQRLADLFRPPYDLMSHVSWDEARDQGKEEKKWILVNLQDMTDFNCQALNRDIWKNEAVTELVRENFIFLQYSKDDPRSEQYTTFYFPHQSHENPNNFPHVSIVDPRTGEQVKVWSGLPFPTAVEFHAQLAEFLDRYSLAANSKNPVVKSKRPERAVDVDRMTEEEMLELALKNSLAASNGHNSTPDLVDPDELTKSTGDLGKGKAKAASSETGYSSGIGSPDMGCTEPPQQEESVFASIPSDKPHVEPENNPATTTRIQLRHPTGRVIRRFNLDDTVSRIYEWLKAEPLEGKAGVNFELKTMPQGRDLIGNLGQTIAEAGLKQGTIMVEFLED